jgi:hypothetical protein
LIIALDACWLLELHEALSWFLGLRSHKLLDLLLSLVLLVKLLLKWIAHLV